MLLVLRPLALVDYTVVRSQFTFAVSLIVPPLAFVPIKLPPEVVTEAVATIVAPLTDVEIVVVVVAVPIALSQIHPPLSVILVIALPVSVTAAEDANAVANLDTIKQDLTFVVVSIPKQLSPPDVQWVVLLWLIIVFTDMSRHDFSLLLRLSLLDLTRIIIAGVVFMTLLMYLS